MNERSRLWFVNWPLVAIVIALSVYGSLMVQSATAGMSAGPALFRRHLLGLAIGLVPLVVAWAFDYRKLQGWIGPLLILNAMLILSPRVPGLGASAKGATSWLSIAGIRLFQPSEPAKLLTIIVMAAIISTYKGKIERPVDLAKVLGVLLVPLGLIMLQPDLGTGMVFIAITAGMLLIGGLKPRWFLALGIAGVVLVGGLLSANTVLDKALNRDVLIKQYQLDRLLVFVDPSRDPKGAGYNLEQSKIAIGSGELTGKGLGSGTQSNLRFLPEPHTDFIFSVTAEEIGFFGALILLGLYLGLVDRRTRDRRILARPVRVAYRSGCNRHVDVSDSREHGDDDRTHADHGHPAPVHELRIVVHGHQHGRGGYAPVRVDETPRRLRLLAVPRGLDETSS